MAAAKVSRKKSPLNGGTHLPVRKIVCPKCGFELHYTSRTTRLSCCCGTDYRLVSQPGAAVGVAA